jgi:opacity protein-like surface antigen
MLISKQFIACATIAASLIVPSTALANDQDIVATTIPATACRPQTDSGSAAVALSNGAYVFNGSATGTVILFCPLPINANTIADFTNDNDISRYRVYYRDSDGIGTASEVRTSLVYRNSVGLTQVGGTWSSNASNITANTIAAVNLSHDVGSDRLYSFAVIMQRTNTTQNPAFSGIDFPPIAIP